MAIDPSIPLAAGQINQGNMGNSLMQLMQLRGAGLQQRALDQQYNANLAQSEIIRQATDPATGQLDLNKAARLMAQDPRAAYNLPEFQARIAQQRSAQLEQQTKEFDLASKQLNWMKGGLGSMLDNPALSQQDIIKFVGTGIRQGFLTPEQAATELQNMPADPVQLQGWVRDMYVQSLDGEAQLNAIRPQTQVIGTGAQQNIVALDPLTGRPTIAGQLTNQLSPEQATQPTQFFNPATGQMETITREQFAALQGGQPGGMAGTGRYPGTPGINPTSGVQLGAIGLPAGPALGATAAADVAGEGAAKGALALQNNAEGAQNRVFFLQDMARNLQSFESGPAADWTAKANALALQLAPDMAQKLGIDPQSVASKEEFTKFATNLAIQTAGQLGGGTDNQLAAAVSGNPNASLSNLGNDQIIKTLIGLERATQAKNLAWQQSGQQPQNYQRWSAQWNNDIDPRVFVSDELSEAERAKMYKGMNAKDQARFRNSWKLARQTGLVGGGANGGL